MRNAAPALGVLLLLAACGAPSADRSDADISGAVLPGPGASVAFGPAHAPEGGRLVVAFLVPTPPSERLVNLIGEDALAAFRAAEARGEDEGGEEPLEEIEEIEEVVEDDVGFGEGWGFHHALQTYRKQVARRVEKATGVRVAFRDVLADELRDEPLVIVRDRELHEDEIAPLERYLARGGRVLRDALQPAGVGRPCPGVLPPADHAVRVLTNACVDAIRTSALVHRFPADPLEVLNAERRGDEVRVRLRAHPTEAILRSFDGEDVARIEARPDGSLAFDCPDPALDPYRHVLVAVWREGAIEWTRAYRIVDLVGTPERRLVASKQVEAGATYAPRILFLNSKTGEPAEGIEDTLSLVRGEETIAVAAGTTNAEGALEATLAIPLDLAPGRAKLEVGGQRFTVEILSGVRVSVVTDRGLYRPDDEIHVRVMVHDAARGRPVSDAEVALTFRRDEQKVRTSEHGIASALFRIAGGRLGEAEVEAEVRGVEATSKLEIRAFETPSFLVTLDPPHLELRRGETVPLRVEARHVNGSPLVGARVWASSGTHLPRGRRGETDETGHFTIPVTLHAPVRRQILTLYVQDAEGRTVREIVDVVLRAPESPARVAAAAPDEPAPRPDRLSLRPRERVLTVGDELALDVRGPDGPVWIDVARDGSLLQGLSATLVDGHALLSLPLTADLAGLLSLRAWRLSRDRPHGVRTRVLVTRGRALTVTASPEQEAYRPGETARLAVRVADGDGEPTAAVLGYWGVDEALLAFAEMPDGREEIFDVLPAERSAGLEGLAQAQEDGGAVDARLAAKLLWATAAPRSLSGLYRIQHRWQPDLESEITSATRKAVKARVDLVREHYVVACASVPIEELRTAGELREVLLFLVRGGYLDADFLADPWGTPLAVGQGRGRWHEPSGENSWWIHFGTPVVSAGPDLAFGTRDDVFLVWRPHHRLDFPGRLGRFLALVEDELGDSPDSPWFDTPFLGPAWNSLIGLGGGAGGAFGGRGGSRDLGAGGGGKGARHGTLHVREDFAPTLCFVPEAIVGPEGTTTLELPLRDQVTTWRMRLVASAPDGATGVGHAALRVRQPLHTDPWIAPHLTVGDEVEVPVAVRAETEGALDVALRLLPAEGLASIGDAVAVVHLEPYRTAAHVFRLRAEAPGAFRVRVEARSEDHADVIERIVHVRPNGREVVHVANATISSDRPATLVLPAFAEGTAPAASELRVYPTTLCETVAGLEGLIREPHGCFEQTSSTVYPMVLALDYLNRTKQVDPELKSRAYRHVESGYQRLLGYEVKEQEGGYSLWGKAPASLFLSAYAYHEFYDMRRWVGTSDAYARVAKYLLSQQAEDGSWQPEGAGAAHGDDAALRRAYPLTAYVAWGLARAKKADEKSLAWLGKHREEIEDPYALALAALAFQAADLESGIARELAARLAVAKSVDAHGVTWHAASSTNMRGRGRSADIEATALVAQVLLADGRYPDLARQALARLVSARSRNGSFGTTQSTVLALQALLAADPGAPRQEEARLRLSQGPEQELSLRLTPGSTDTVTLALDGGSHPLEARLEGAGRVRVQLSQSGWVPWGDVASASRRLAFDVQWPEGELPVGEVAYAEVRVRNGSPHVAATVTLEVGLPPGCTVESGDVTGEGAERVERGETTMVVYLGDLAPGQERRFRLPFTPRYAFGVVTAPSKAYEYYVPEEAAVVPPRPLRARR